MGTGGICPERERLLRDVSAALNRHNKAVGEMATIAGSNRTALFSTAREVVAGTKQEVEVARDALEAHMIEHGCQLLTR
ncbi:MAG: hypothetical protein JOZ62_04670 [Acidobacteriaceae bacterium]|nr:hypothetical protein [Acidobacteriaceae bacterium]